MRALATIAAALLSLSLPSCAQGDAELASQERNVRTEIEGIEGFVLGAKFEDILRAKGDDFFSSSELEHCFENLSLYGCEISSQT